MEFVNFMQSPVGRAARVIVGVVLIASGVALGGFGWALVVVGLVPFAAGALGVCLVAPALRAPMRRVSQR